MINKPRVLFVLPATVMGGAEIRLINMINAFNGIEPILAGHRRLLEHISLPAEVHWLDNFPGCQDPYPYHWQNVRCYAAAIGCLGQQLQPEVTFGWMHNGASFVAIAKLLHHLPGVTAGSILGPLTDHFALNQRVATAYERVLFGFACRYLKKMITPSQGVRLDLISHFFAPPSRVTTIYNGVDLRRVAHLANERPDQPFPVKRGFWVLAASRLSREKGLDVMLTAFARVCAETDSTLILLGEGPERTLLEQLIHQLGLADRVLMPGYIQNPFPWLAKADVFLSASRLEGFGTALVEAMSLGIPVISTACRAGPIEILAEAGSGLLVPVDDPEALAAALRVILRDSNFRTKLSEGGRRRAAHFEFETMLRGYEDVLRDICAS